MSFDLSDEQLAKDRMVAEREVSSLSASQLQRKLDEHEPIEFSHSLETQIGGQISAGSHLVGFYEDHWFDQTWLFSNLSPICIATRALRPG